MTIRLIGAVCLLAAIWATWVIELAWQEEFARWHLSHSLSASLIVGIVRVSRGNAALIWGALLGLGHEALSQQGLGPLTCLTGLAAWFLSRKFEREGTSSITIPFSIGAASLLAACFAIVRGVSGFVISVAAIQEALLSGGATLLVAMLTWFTIRTICGIVESYWRNGLWSWPGPRRQDWI